MTPFRRFLRVGAPVAGVAGLVCLWQPADAGITSLYADDATLVEQLIQLFEINAELDAVSDGVIATAGATRDLLYLYHQSEAAIAELQAYGPEAFWKDFRADLYSHYPGFEYLEGHKNLAEWKHSTTRSPIEAYDLIGATFGDLTADLREREAEGKIDTRTLHLHRFEAAGALSLANASVEATEGYDRDAVLLAEQAAAARTADEAQVLSAKALAQIASQQSHLIRLLSRQVRLDGIDAAMRYGAELKAHTEFAEVDKSTHKHMESAAKPATFLTFEPVW